MERVQKDNNSMGAVGEESDVRGHVEDASKDNFSEIKRDFNALTVDVVSCRLAMCQLIMP